MARSEVSKSVVKRSEGLSNRVSIIIIRYIDHVRFAAYIAVSLTHFFIFFWFYFVSLYMWLYCILLLNFVNYSFLLLSFVFLLLCYVFLLLRLCTLFVMYVPFWVF